jgi:ABC-2 type transport system permease protein
MTDSALLIDTRTVKTSTARQPLVPTNLLRSEWAKLRSVRSTYWSVGLVVVAIVGYGAINSASHTSPQGAGFDPISTALTGVLFAQLAIAVLGVLAITSEYSTGMIRSTFAAAPQRHAVIGAKMGVVGTIGFLAGAASGLIAFLAGQAILGSNGVSLTSPGALRSIVGVGLYLGLLGVLAVALGTVIRSSTGAIAAVVAVLLLLPAVLLALPVSLRDSVIKFMPGNAGQAIFATSKDASSLSPWAGLAVFTVYVAVAIAISLILVRRRDA